MLTVQEPEIQEKEIPQQEYDVVIMGAGFAGVCQARHLMLKIPNIRVAMVDPRPEDRTDKDLKIGESTIEIATMFICKELGLYEYIIENHPPKYGLNFHWPKDTTTTEGIDDYYHIWANRQPPMASTQMNRAKFERDLIAMNKKMGATYYKGRVADVDITPGDAIKTVHVKLGSDSINLKAKHIIDAAGRKFIIGKKTDNVTFDPSDLFGVNSGSVWVRINNVDRTLFHDGYDPTAGTCSHYYGTNHFFGHGHWLWMIPTEIDSKELSIGVIYHRSVISDDQMNTKEKFCAFLKANHQLLYKLVSSSEGIDFHYRPQVAHMSKTLFSEDNWYVVGDAAYIFDAFYSTGTTMASLAIEGVTEIIRAKLANKADAETKRTAYNDFNIAFAKNINQLIYDHWKQLGNASVMSWRIYFDYMFWFGVLLPMYIGKWHLDLTFIKGFVAFTKSSINSGNGFNKHVYDLFTEVIKKGNNIGLMDCYRADQLIFGYHTPKHFDDFLENAKYETARCNVFAGMKNTFFFQAVWYTMFRWKAFGILGVLAPKYFYYTVERLMRSANAAIAEMVYKYQISKVPVNTKVEEMRQEFNATYQYRAELQPWSKA
ncbi:tryptophan 7-halogenase [Anabaena cylindrica UHCC 0172]|uniref:NAD(P)/FAD-dependent oxidoreductase n=1 Tax=Anabaena cylindrica TaxID=1165 RepID=UPI002B203D80|nr:tryptophan 7-halogenase [Anabaena cylindrica]MEA5550948.1 tryptophan 7-halogenase [Anabaena cylindrica UHCC 0172]